MTTRVGIVGLGFIGRRVYDAIVAAPELELEVAFVFDRNPERLEDCAAPVVVTDLATFRDTSPDLVVEAASPDVTRLHGTDFLRAADYLPLSLTALADPQLERELVSTARATGHRLLIPHGALVGVDSLVERGAGWTSVTITFRKHPSNIDLTDSGIDPRTLREPTVIHDGPVREIAGRFPRNVNAMVAGALATVGLDRCRAVLIADPGLDCAVAEVRAESADGALIETIKRGPMVGVSGVEMADALLRSMIAATGPRPGLQFV
jgi:predicted dinucleotide-utilizing enzyme